MEVETIKVVLDYIDCGIVNNICNGNYRVFMRMIHCFLLKTDQINPEFRFQLLQQTNHIKVKLFTYKNVELENDYRELRHMVLESIEEDNEEKSSLLFYKWL